MNLKVIKLSELPRRQFLRLSALTATGAIAAACVASPAPDATGPGATEATAPAVAATGEAGTLKFGYAQKTSVDHFFHMRDSAGGTDIYCRRFANAKLLTADAAMTGYEPDLAESWELAEDQLSLTFNLRPGLTWHDGEAFTADDVLFTWKMMSIPGLGGGNLGTPFTPHIVGLQEWMDGTAEEIAGIHVVDENTVAFDLIAPAGLDLLELLFDAVCIAPEHILADFLDRERAPEILQSEWATTASHVGLGPFRVIEYVADQYIIYEPFEKYHRGQPVLEKLIYQSYADGQTLVAALETQEVDVGRIPDTEYGRFQELTFLHTQIDQSGWVLSTPFNTRRPYLADKRVRQALLYAIDREAITEAVYRRRQDSVGNSSLLTAIWHQPRHGHL